MLIKKPNDIPSSEITPRRVYLSRRTFLAGGAAAVGAALVAGRQLFNSGSSDSSVLASSSLGTLGKSPYSTTEEPTAAKYVTNYNNFYEFGTDKDDPVRNAKDFVTRPWSVSVEGEIKKPRRLDLDEIIKMAPLEERIYRLRCVEGWSVVVPWIGFSLSNLIKKVEPTSKAKYVAFQTLYDPKQMPQARWAGIDFPYVEGLRMDEAMHPLAILCVGMYGATLPNQDGAPIRLVVPWKYGFKSIKSLVKIRFVEQQPPTTWNLAQPQEYGFYSNVNPEVDHPRWSQATERRLPGFQKNHKTLMFNGYADQVASLYSGIDLRKNY
ncbi:MAG: protein-methionine-sulfoxide reductase catalytic subunit MsrP [Acidobacteriales bacterium]|nr:protein-methionine-sulfoxide reductase catalytic subunit MsrP [Terriglobales bacterium]